MNGTRTDDSHQSFTPPGQARLRPFSAWFFTAQTRHTEASRHAQEQRLRQAQLSEVALCRALREHLDLEEVVRRRAQEAVFEGVVNGNWPGKLKAWNCNPFCRVGVGCVKVLRASHWQFLVGKSLGSCHVPRIHHRCMSRCGTRHLIKGKEECMNYQLYIGHTPVYVHMRISSHLRRIIP